MIQRFSLPLFIDNCQKSGLTYMETLDALKLWANDCNRLTKEEVKEKITYVNDEWFEFEEN